LQGGKNAHPVFFLPKISFFFGYWAEKEQIEKNKYFLNDYLGILHVYTVHQYPQKHFLSFQLTHKINAYQPAVNRTPAQQADMSP
jgi:hypothetical protein